MRHVERSGAAGGRPEPLNLYLAVDAAALAGARRALSDWLRGAGVSRRDVGDVLIAANEACMNAVEHSGTPRDERIRLLARADGGRLWVEVRDSGRWREPTDNPDRGHGMSLMRELTDALTVEREEGGTRVVMEKALTFGGAPRPPAASPTEVAAERIDGVCVARLSGEVDLASVERVESEIDAAAGRDPGALVVDLSGVGYLDSAGVHMLYRLGHRRRRAGEATCIVAPAGPVRRVLELTNMEAAMPLEEAVDSGIERVERAAPP